jgi:O-antigen/teichoic acid export membrane protein
MELKLLDFTKNAAITAVTRIFIFLFSLCTTIIIARILGPEGKGIYSLAVLLPAMIMKFTNLGIGPATVYYVAKREFPEGMVFGNNIILSLILGILSMIIGAGIIVLFHNIIFPGVKPLYLFYALILAPLTILNTNILHILLGKQYMVRYNIMSFLYAFVLFISVTLCLIVFRLHILGLIIATVVALSLVDSILVVHRINDTRVISFVLNKNYVSKTIGFGLPSNVSNILTYMNYRFDMLLVSAFMTPTAVGLYSVSVGVVEQSWLLSSSAGTVLFPRISNERNEQVKRELTPFICRNIIFITTLIAIALYFTSPWLIQLLFSNKFTQAVAPLRILLPGIVALSGWHLLYNDIAGRGKPHLNVYVNLVAVTVNILLNIFLIPRYGIRGAALATTISYSTAFIGTVFIYRRITGNSLLKLLLLQSKDFFLYKSR